MKSDFIAKVDVTCTSFFLLYRSYLVVQSIVRKEKESRFVLHFHVSFYVSSLISRELNTDLSVSSRV